MDSALRYNRPVTWNGRPIRSWAAFHSVVKQPGRPLLATLDDFSDPIVRSGERPTLSDTWLGPSRLTKACASYVVKTAQAAELRERLGDRIAVVDYDELVAHKHTLLPRLCEFAGVAYDKGLAGALHDRSVGKRDRLGEKDAERVDGFCSAVYDRALALRTMRAS